jgi:para-aminobenzoate synthetase / 4-amino-4-deoxychorismate lyase
MQVKEAVPFLKAFNDTDIQRLTSWLARQENFVFLESSRLSIENHRSFLFIQPQRFLVCHGLSEATAFLTQVDALRGQGFFLAGWLDYEFGYVLEPRLHRFLPQHQERPLAVLGVYQQPLIFDHRSGLANGDWPLGEEDEDPASDVTDLCSSIGQEEYLRAVQQIQNYLQAGDSYQVNFTFHLNFSWQGCPAALYRRLRRNQSVAYSAWIRYKGKDILSFSPELFFRSDPEKVRVRPMKGTLSRGRTTAEDAQRQQELAADAKNRSENIMIVDLLRNDLGHLLQNTGGGLVQPRSLFEVESYESLLQMTSTIDGLPHGATPSFRQLMEALFPCGSVTGAPKIRTMEIIAALEKQQRGVYCGAIGWTGPQESCFNVPIRTLELDKGRGRMGIGSGIVNDSNAEEEWAECLLKGRFLTRSKPDIQLIETLLWEPDQGFFLLDYHLERLLDSARYFHFFCVPDEIPSRLAEAVQGQTERLRLRLLLHRDGRLDLCSTPCPVLPLPAQRPKVVFSTQQVDSSSPYLFHKTTERSLYAQERQQALDQGFYEVLFTNLEAQVTEGAISNLMLRSQVGQPLLTPPLSCGLLAGTYRRWLLEQGQAVEQQLSPAEVLAAAEVYVVNSVRGMVRVDVLRPPQKAESNAPESNPPRR